MYPSDKMRLTLLAIFLAIVSKALSSPGTLSFTITEQGAHTDLQKAITIVIE